MIFIGTMNLTRTRDVGNFLCPACGVAQGYRLRASRPWLTLYFIPTIPVGDFEFFVQCDHCKLRWDDSVLEMNHPNPVMAEENQFCDQAVRATMLVVLADCKISENEISALQRISQHFWSRHVGRDELGKICSNAQQNQIEAANYVLTVSRNWNQEQRSRALQGMFLAASADGPLDPSQLAILAKMQELFDFTDAEYHGAIEQALEWES